MTPSGFPFTEVVLNELPQRIQGWAQAWCSGTYDYECEPGYVRKSCEPGETGTHGGCSYCLMVLMTCECRGN